MSGRPDLCLVSSCGGHLAELRRLAAAYEHRPHFWVLNDRVPLAADMAERTYFITHAGRGPRLLLNCVEAWRILRFERPRLILSAGASPAVPFAMMGMLLGIRTVFVESLTRVSTPSLTGRLMYRLAAVTFYQWPGLRRWFPRGRFAGALL